MFTGIVAAVGRVVEVTPSTGGVRLRIDAGALSLDDVAIGDSIAVNGACLTVVSRTDRSFDVDLSPETLACVVGFAAHAQVNLEKALRLADRLGGHLVSGHVDGIGVVQSVQPAGDNRVIAFTVPETLARYVARKGSIAVNGVSLTVNEVSGTTFAVNLIPHTLASTNLQTLQSGAQVNIEIDLVARYCERLLDVPATSGTRRA
jgi:riboflavin synthase